MASGTVLISQTSGTVQVSDELDLTYIICPSDLDKIAIYFVNY